MVFFNESPPLYCTIRNSMSSKTPVTLSEISWAICINTWAGEIVIMSCTQTQIQIWSHSKYRLIHWKLQYNSVQDWFGIWCNQLILNLVELYTLLGFVSREKRIDRRFSSTRFVYENFQNGVIMKLPKLYTDMILPREFNKTALSPRAHQACSSGQKFRFESPGFTVNRYVSKH